ncbi:MAG: NADH-quinone oxidoreductase subunit J [Variovorax paradoxus]|uniref:NADH-quinone oxidoreductase subunit K n=1 Tax=Variovorax paradoxus TaxID=34073 RepID=A0A2W5Q1P0_VARPD|nr:MAG: NADH-quinone oxidoreductase subunit J [Variovorax paradoxus]
MDVKTGFFYLFSVVLLFAAFRVITARNPVHAVLYLMLAFSQAAAVWLLLKAEFLAIALVLVYLGAVMVLFLFVVMMLDLNIDSLRQGFWKHFPLAALIGVVIALEMAYVLMGGFRLQGSAPAEMAQAAAAQGSNTKALGLLLYSEYVYPVQIAAVILVVAMIAAIALTLRQRKDTKFVNVKDQVHVKAAERMSVVKLAATLPPPSLGAMLFALSVIGIFLNRKNLIVLLMCIELMLLAVNMNFVAFSHYLGDMHGQIFVFFILTVAAAESAIGLALLVLLFRNKSNINVDELNSLKG